MIVKNRSVFGPMLAAVLLFHFALFEQNPMNPIGIKFVNEAYLGISLFFAFFILIGSLGTHNAQYRIMSAFCIYMSVVFIGIPALFSYLYYGQPIYYGLIEERRVLFCFSFALLLFLGKRLSAGEFEKTVLTIALVAVVLSWLCYFELLPDWRDREGADLSRPGRSSVGVLGIVMAYCFCIYMWAHKKSPISGEARRRLPYLILAAVFFLTLVFVTQTRQILLVCLLFSLFTLKGRAIPYAMAGAFIAAPIILNPHILEPFGVNLDFYISSVQDGTQDQVRPWTIHQIMTHLDDNHWLPSGSLSLMWNEGFRPHFGYYFFLSDVGIFGTLFRFGLLAFWIIPISLFVYYATAKRLNKNLSFVLPIFVANLAIWPLQGMFEYLQGLTAFLFVVQALKTLHQREVIATPMRPVPDALYPAFSRV